MGFRAVEGDRQHRPALEVSNRKETESHMLKVSVSYGFIVSNQFSNPPNMRRARYGRDSAESGRRNRNVLGNHGLKNTRRGCGGSRQSRHRGLDLVCELGRIGSQLNGRSNMVNQG